MGAASSTSKRLERAEKTGVLALREQGASSLPDRVWTLRSLRSLDVGHNRLLSLPQGVGKLSSLTSLAVEGNRLKALPPALGQLTKLENLTASHNLLTALPDALAALARLKKLAVSHNSIELSALAQADLSFNQLSSPLVPGLGGLKRIKTLDLRGNIAILELPPELLRDTPLHRLEVEPHLIGNDGLLREMDGSTEYLERRKARIEQEVAGKSKGGEITFD